MSINRSRLDRFISKQCQMNKKSVRLLLAQKRVQVDGIVAFDIAQIVDKFSHIVLDEQVLQANIASYIMLHKPVGVVCATKDDKHTTVLDLLNGDKYPEKENLHIVGRLDLNTSGLVLLTNDSRWSEHLTGPMHKVEKRYLVTLAKPLSADYIPAFAKGMYFAYEGITTKPATLAILSTTQAQVSLIEGRYHQIKRMFGRFRNPVLSIHRQSIGLLEMEESLAIAQSRLLSASEVDHIAHKSLAKL